MVSRRKTNTLAEVWGQSFGDRLAIRESSQHSQCWICVRHKYIIRKLSKDRLACGLQLKEYEHHLSQQYQDRTIYWSDRSASRLPRLPNGNRIISIICDAMDHSKYRYPRSPIFASKEFSGCVRPCLDATAVVIHGYLVLNQKKIVLGQQSCSSMPWTDWLTKPITVMLTYACKATIVSGKLRITRCCEQAPTWSALIGAIHLQ